MQKKISNIKLVVLDLDGTMVDSVPDLAYCTNKMLTQLNYPNHKTEKIKQWVGNGVVKLIERAISGKLHNEAIDKDLMQKATNIFNKLYANNLANFSQLYPSTLECLEYLKQKKFYIACVTNKPIQFSNILMQKLNIFNFFDVILGGDSLKEKKPSKIPITYLLDKFNISNNECILIGDSITDIKTAKNSNCKIICVSYGYNHGNDITAENPDIVIDSLSDIKNIII